MKHFFLASGIVVVCALGMLLAFFVDAAAVPRDLIKLSCGADAEVNDPCRAVYYVGHDTRVSPEAYRMAFPSAAFYRTWYADFSEVKEISAQEMAGLVLRGNVQARPGTMVKIQSGPRVYAVDAGYRLIPIESEAAARAFAGDGWARQVIDIPESLFTGYAVVANEMVTVLTAEGIRARMVAVTSIEPPIQTTSDAGNQVVVGPSSSGAPVNAPTFTVSDSDEAVGASLGYSLGNYSKSLNNNRVVWIAEVSIEKPALQLKSVRFNIVEPASFINSTQKSVVIGGLPQSTKVVSDGDMLLFTIQPGTTPSQFSAGKYTFAVEHDPLCTTVDCPSVFADWGLSLGRGADMVFEDPVTKKEFIVSSSVGFPFAQAIL